MTADDATNETMNVGGTRNALELAEALRGRLLPPGVARWPPPASTTAPSTRRCSTRARRLPSPYHRTKFESEKLVREEATVPWRVYRPAIVVGHSRDRRDGQGRRPLLLLPADQAAARHACPPGCRWSASTSATPTWCRSTTSPRRWTTSPTCPDRDGEAFHLVNPEPQPVVDVINAFCAAAGAPQFATPVDRRVDRRRCSALLPAAAAPAARSSTALVRTGPGPGWSSTRPSAGSASRPRCSRHIVVHRGLRLPPHREGAGRLGHRASPTSSPTPARCGATGRRTSTSRPAATRPSARRSTGKYVVITGASSGIGQVTALKVAQAGGIPVLVARGKDKLEETRATIEPRGGTAHVYPCDLSDLEAIDRAVRAADRRAAVASTSSSTTPAARSGARCGSRHDRFHDFERTMQLNYFGAIRLVMGLLPTMREQQRGHIVNISLDRRADQPAAVLGVRRVQGRARRVEQRRGLRAGRRRHHLHQHPHAAGADADDRADQDLRQVPHDLAGAGRRPGDQGDGRAPARDQHRCSATSARSRTRWRPKLAFRVLQLAYQVFPDSAAAKGERRRRDPRVRADHARQGCSRASTGEVSPPVLTGGSVNYGRAQRSTRDRPAGSVIQPLQLPG